jgi:hypothetical protein
MEGLSEGPPKGAYRRLFGGILTYTAYQHWYGGHPGAPSDTPRTMSPAAKTAREVTLKGNCVCNIVDKLPYH